MLLCVCLYVLSTRAVFSFPTDAQLAGGFSGTKRERAGRMKKAERATSPPNETKRRRTAQRRRDVEWTSGVPLDLGQARHLSCVSVWCRGRRQETGWKNVTGNKSRWRRMATIGEGERGRGHKDEASLD